MEVSNSEERVSRVGGTEEGGEGIDVGVAIGEGVTGVCTRGVVEKVAVWNAERLGCHFEFNIEEWDVILGRLGRLEEGRMEDESCKC
jgi:hypothetical protein